MDTFFRRFGDRAAILDGVLVRSVNHLVCERLILTGRSQPGSSDWPSILGADWGDQLPVPNLVLGGPSEPGKLARFTSVAGGGDQLKKLLDGTIRNLGDLRPDRMPTGTENIVDRALQDRITARLAAATHPADQRMLEAYVDGLDRSLRLRDESDGLTIANGLLDAQVDSAVQLLEAGLARCLCISRAGWDSHSDNHEQTDYYQNLFSELIRLMDQLDAAQGANGPLSQETTVVVVSEMGRTPYMNTKFGKDHWPYTSAMLIGSGVAGGRRIGGYDPLQNGRPVDLINGDIRDDGTVLMPENLGATLLTIAGMDPTEWVSGADPVRYVMG